MPPWFGWIVVGLAAWLWGSFLNQLVDRWYGRLGSPTSRSVDGSKPGSSSEGEPVSLFRPARSHCLKCGSLIRWFDNIPVLSYLILRGRCRQCGAVIGLRTFLIESAIPLIGLGIYRIWGAGWRSAAAWAGASWLLVALPMLQEGRTIPRWLWVAGLAWALLAVLALTLPMSP